MFANPNMRFLKLNGMFAFLHAARAILNATAIEAIDGNQKEKMKIFCGALAGVGSRPVVNARLPGYGAVRVLSSDTPRSGQPSTIMVSRGCALCRTAD